MEFCGVLWSFMKFYGEKSFVLGLLAFHNTKDFGKFQLFSEYFRKNHKIIVGICNLI